MPTLDKQNLARVKKYLNSEFKGDIVSSEQIYETLGGRDYFQFSPSTFAVYLKKSLEAREIENFNLRRGLGLCRDNQLALDFEDKKTEHKHLSNLEKSKLKTHWVQQEKLIPKFVNKKSPSSI